MKTFIKSGIIAAAVLLAAAAAGPGTALAEENHTIGEFMEWPSTSTSTPTPTQRVQTSHVMGEFMEWQAEPPVHTGAMPETGSVEIQGKDQGKDPGKEIKTN